MIEINGLVKRYGQRAAVDGVSFSVREGEIFGLLGPNGAGKTTTLSILSTLLEPDAGQVSIGSFDLAREAARIKPLIGYVPQELALFPTLSAWDNLAFFGRIYRLSGPVLKERINAVLDLVGLRDRAGDAVKTFSGGMQRRLNIAVGLIHQPRILFLDEPTVGVDPQSRIFIFEHVESLKAEGMTVLYTTHYMEEAERLCDRVAIMDRGQVLALDTTKNLIRLLGGGVIYAGLPSEAVEDTLPA
jgi:ABC-2 type transport system ATP-binding protein